MTKSVKLYGCRYSGTKYMTRLLELNWDVEVCLKKYGHKHRQPVNLPQDIPVVIIHKHPAAYIASVKRRPWWGDKAPVNVRIGDWIRCHSTWFKLKNEHLAIVKYEDLLYDFAGTMERIEEALKLIPIKEEYENILTFCGNLRNPVRTEYYTNKEYMDLMTSEDLTAINKIPVDLLKKLGYTVT